MKRLMILCLITSLQVFAEGDSDGGCLTIWPKNHGRFVFVNAQSVANTDKLKAQVESLAETTGYDIAFSNGTAPDLKDVPQALNSLGAKGAVWIVNNQDMPISLGACEEGWGIVNVAKMTSDGATDAMVSDRLLKVSLRLFGNVNGAAATTESPHCVLETAYGLKGVDSIRCPELSPFALMRIGAYFDMAGYKHVLCGSYLDACEAGWAPLPTNAVQKAIWEKVHKIPTNPMRILPESKRNQR